MVSLFNGHELIIKFFNSEKEEAIAVADWIKKLLARMLERAEPIRQLAYHLYTLCERKGWADDARSYNELITSWNTIMAASLERGHINEQIELL